MQLGKKSKTTDLFNKVRGDLGADAEENTPLVAPIIAPVSEKSAPAQEAFSFDGEAVHVTITEAITAKLSREGTLNSLTIKGDLQLRISDPDFAKVKLDLVADTTSGAQFRTHPKVDKALFTKSKIIQTKDPEQGYPLNTSIGVLRWNSTAPTGASAAAPITLTVWVNKGSGSTYNITIEYELTGDDELKDVVVSIPFSTAEPTVSSYDATYEVAGDRFEWAIGTVNEDTQSGSFEFEAVADDESEFFPMTVSFSKTKPFIDVDVSRSFIFL
jgi:hypothetical protein